MSRKLLRNLMLITVISVLCIGMAVTANALDETGQCGENVYWTYYSCSGELVISGSGPMYDYDNNSDSPFYENNTIKRVYINDGVTTIGVSAFELCRNIEYVIIPDSVTHISARAFIACTNIDSITIPNSVTNIGEYAFGLCDSLESITIPGSVTNIGDFAFDYCNNLVTITILDGVRSIGAEAFGDCDKLKSITIPASVTSISVYAFNECDSIEKIIVAENNTTYSNDNYGVLFNKDKTTLLIYPAANTETSYSIPDSVTEIGCSAFNYSNVESITIPDSVISIGEKAFLHCANLKNVEIPDSVTSIGNEAFIYCTSLKKITIPGSVKSIGACTFFYCDSLESVTILEGIENIGNSAFYYCDSLKNITIPVSVKSILPVAFFGCTNLAEVYFGGTKDEWSIIEIGRSNENLTNATIHYNTDKHSYFESAFMAPNCTEDGYKVVTCSCGYNFTETINATGHSIIALDSRVATCTEVGYEAYEYCEKCTYTTYKEIPATGHTYNIISSLAPSCTANGYKVYTCSCSHSYTETIPTTSHSYGNDNICDNCGASKMDNCSCNCHKSGFMGIVWKILNFFYKIFGMNKTCVCGVAHY